ncbi:hypothetical protein T11_10585 [Trichinella zimbabwensis]|uniref:Uncharacterized protein n=1 Tax=Trichinella zimbabwensis TaxID=268475 RepID=A0A0V1HYC1_9BILA|nr:hypothetical protein T11_10585 [Trichinella zimbabwensis]
MMMMMLDDQLDYRQSTNAETKKCYRLLQLYSRQLISVVVLLLQFWHAINNGSAMRKVGQSKTPSNCVKEFLSPLIFFEIILNNITTWLSNLQRKKAYSCDGYSQIFTEQLTTTACCRLCFYYTMNLDIQLYAPANRVCSTTAQCSEENHPSSGNEMKFELKMKLLN